MHIGLGFRANAQIHHYTLTQVRKGMLLDSAQTIGSQDTVAIVVVRSCTHKAAWAVQVTEPLRRFSQPPCHFVQATKEMPPKHRVTVPDMCRFVGWLLAKHWVSKGHISKIGDRHR